MVTAAHSTLNRDVPTVWDDVRVQVAQWLSELTQLPEPSPIRVDDIEALRAELDACARTAVGLLEDSLGGSLDPGELRLPKSRLVALEQCERAAVATAERSVDAPVGRAVLRGVALDRFVIHQLRAGRVLEPSADLRSMLLAEGEWGTLAALDEHETADPAAVAGLLEPLASSVADSWGSVGPEWHARTQSRATLALADARVVCSGVVDVELGGTDGLPRVVIEVKSGAANPTHVSEVALYALLLAVRDGAAPRVVARWYPGAAPAATAVTVGVLESAARRLGDGIGRWAQLRSGREPTETPGNQCGWCPDADVCPSAARSATDDALLCGSNRPEPAESVGSW